MTNTFIHLDTTLPIVQRQEILLVFDNRLLGRKGALVFADSEQIEGNMVVNNLRSENRSDFYRSGSVFTASQLPIPEIRVKWMLGSPRDIQWLSVNDSNLQLPWRGDLYRGDPGFDGLTGTLLGTSGFMHPIVKSVPADFTYDEYMELWYLQPTNERIVAMARDFRLATFVELPAPIYGVDHILFRFLCTDATNGLDDFIQISSMWAGTEFQPAIGTNLGVKLTPRDNSLKKRTAGGAMTGVTRPTNVELSFVLDHLTDVEGYTDIFTDWVLTEGHLSRVIFYLEPAAAKRVHFYDGGFGIGTLQSFEGLAIDAHAGQIADIFASKNVKTVKIVTTE